MSEAELRGRPRLLDLFHPRRLFARIDDQPTFVLPTLVLVLCATIYAQVAIGPALPRIMPALLERSFVTEAELIRTFRFAILVTTGLAPVLFLAITAVTSWGILRLVRSRQPFPSVLAMIAHASLWVALGFLARTALVFVSGQAEPSTNLALLIKPRSSLERTMLALTNPFLWLAAWWCARGLLSWGATKLGAIAGGMAPWVVWMIVLSRSAGSTEGFAPTTPVSYEGWLSIQKPTLELRYPPDRADDAEQLATILDGFGHKLAERFKFEPALIRVIGYPDHATLERATGEFLHVRRIGSIRGNELLYVELPGMSAALTRERSLREAMRYFSLMQFRQAGVLAGAPRWFLEGVTHAAAIPASPELEREYRAILRRLGPPSYEDLLAESLYSAPEGPILARSLVDHLAFTFGADTIDLLTGDLAARSNFRDALFARTRLTTSALEQGWRDTMAGALRGPAPPESSAGDDELTPFRERQGR